MNETEIALAQAIFAKPANEWTVHDRNELNKLFLKGHREELKNLRNQ